MYEARDLRFDEALDEVVRPPAWMRDAACTETPEVDFFPGRGESMASATAVCERCHVKLECLAYALERGIHEGIWGGASGRERRRLRARARTGERVS